MSVEDKARKEIRRCFLKHKNIESDCYCEFIKHIYSTEEEPNFQITITFYEIQIDLEGLIKMVEDIVNVTPGGMEFEAWCYHGSSELIKFFPEPEEE